MAPKRKAEAKSEPKAKAKARGKAKPEPEPEEAEEEQAAADENYEAWPVAKLKAKLQELGGTTSGGKNALVERLKALAPAKGEAPAAAPAKRGAPKAKAVPEPAAPEAPSPKKAKTTASSSSAAPAAEKPEAPPVEVHVSGPTQVYFEDGDYSAEYAKSNRSKCNKCKLAIDNGALRIGKKVPSDKFDGMYVQWSHDKCFLQGSLFPRTTHMIAGFSTLRPEDQARIEQKVPTTAPDAGQGSNVDPELGAKLKDQNARIYEIRDALSQLAEYQLKEMLTANEYPTQKLGGACVPIIDLCADGIVFGACGKCPTCGGDMLLMGERYRCKGWINEFLRCTYRTQTPERSVWKLTPAAKQIQKLAKMKLTTGTRLFASVLKDDDRDEDEPPSQPSQQTETKKPPFLGMVFVVLHQDKVVTTGAIPKKIQDNGGSIADNITQGTTVVIADDETPEDDEDNKQIATAKELSIPGVSEDWVNECVESGSYVDMEGHVLWGEAVRRKNVEEARTSKFIEKDGIGIDSDVGDLIKTAHVYVEVKDKVIWSEILTKTDLGSGANSFYTLHLLESDESQGASSYWVFRKWGRIGVSQGGTKLEEFGANLMGAQANFKKLYLERTGNYFGHKPNEFVAKPGLFKRVEVEHKAFSGKKSKTEDGDGGAKTGGDDQPLGKLSKKQIEKGEAVLDKIDAALAEKAEGSAAKQALKAKFAGFSSEYYSLIPHNFGISRPPVINNAEMVGSEKAMLQFYLRMGFEEMGGEEEEKLTPISGVMELALPATLDEAANMVCGKGDIKSCMVKGTTMNKKKAGKPQKPMTPDLYGAILLYTSNAIYKQLNQALRDENRAAVKNFFPYLRLLFEACARLPQQKRTLWRGVGVDLFTQYKVGSTIIWWGVSSCTSDQKVAQNFMAGCGAGASLLTVDVQTACDISEVSFFQNEAESILLPGTQLKVLSSKKVGSKCEIHLQEVGRVVS